MTPTRLRWLMNLWPPFLAAGIRVVEVSPDFRRIRVRLKMRWFNRNYVGTHFGGSLFAMTDPFYMLMYLHNLGRDYLVWDQAASIRFVRPGRGVVTASFELDEASLEQARSATADGDKHLVDHATEVLNAEGEVVAKIQRTVYIRRKTSAANRQD